MEDAWKYWSTSPLNLKLRALPLLYIWGIWLAKNKAIFLEKSSSPEEVAKQGLDILSYFPQTKDLLAPRFITEEQIGQDIPWAYFDGASQDMKCGG